MPLRGVTRLLWPGALRESSATGRASPSYVPWLGGPQFSKGVSEVIADIKYGWHTYYTLVFGRRANLEVGSDGYTEWVQTVPDYFTPNNLYSLPSCP